MREHILLELILLTQLCIDRGKLKPREKYLAIKYAFYLCRIFLYNKVDTHLPLSSILYQPLVPNKIHSLMVIHP